MSLHTPHVKYILFSADEIPVTIYGGMKTNAWYDITGLDKRSSLSINGINKNVERIKSFLECEHAAGLPYSRMSLMGFSQGGAMSLFTGLQLPLQYKLGGLIVLSGYMPGTDVFQLTPGLEDVPIIHCHGKADEVVAYERALESKEFLLSRGVTAYRFVAIEGMGHTVSLSVLEACIDFIKVHLAHDDALVVQPKPFKEMSVKELKQALREAGIGNKAIGFNEKAEFVELLEAHAASSVR
jgi:lysophospholipase-2